MLKALAAGLLLAAVPVCNIPVFRYALERWRAAPYPALLFHKGPLGAEARALLGEIEQCGLNLGVETVDVSKPMTDAQKALQDEGPLPRLVVSYPGQPEAVAWRGSFDAPSVRALTHSPARQETVRRILDGASLVWWLLESGDPARDAAAAGLLEKELARLEKEIMIPKPAPGDPPLRSAIPLKVSFSILRIPKGSPEESALVQTLVRARKSWATPATIPVFGRGRALGSLCGDEIRAIDIQRMAEYVTDACSCEVKELNPGVDLLFAADWDALLEAGPLPPDIKAPPVTLQLPRTSSPPPAPPAPPAPPSRALLWLGLGSAAAIAALAGWYALRKAA